MRISSSDSSVRHPEFKVRLHERIQTHPCWTLLIWGPGGKCLTREPRLARDGMHALEPRVDLVTCVENSAAF